LVFESAFQLTGGCLVSPRLPYNLSTNQPGRTVRGPQTRSRLSRPGHSLPYRPSFICPGAPIGGGAVFIRPHSCTWQRVGSARSGSTTRGGRRKQGGKFQQHNKNSAVRMVPQQETAKENKAVRKNLTYCEDLEKAFGSCGPSIWNKKQMVWTTEYIHEYSWGTKRGKHKRNTTVESLESIEGESCVRCACLSYLRWECTKLSHRH
jgi:hypothetical protein